MTLMPVCPVRDCTNTVPSTIAFTYEQDGEVKTLEVTNGLRLCQGHVAAALQGRIVSTLRGEMFEEPKLCTNPDCEAFGEPTPHSEVRR